MQKEIFLTCMCLHSREFHCWHCHPMTSFLSEWGEWPLKGIRSPPGCWDHCLLPVILFGELPATTVQGDWQAAYKLLWRPLDGKDVGVLVDDAAVRMELFYLFIYHYHYNFIIITTSFSVQLKCKYPGPRGSAQELNRHLQDESYIAGKQCSYGIMLSFKFLRPSEKNLGNVQWVKWGWV